MSDTRVGTLKSGWCLTGKHEPKPGEAPTEPYCERPDCTCRCHPWNR